jgi:23S rRNA (pseudouridine1915-N3)-methyltransferase
VPARKWLDASCTTVRLKLHVLAVGHRPAPWIAAGFDEYAKRMPRGLPVRLVEIKPELPPRCVKVVLDERGRGSTTRELAQRIAQWQLEGRDAAFVIGGADGLSAVMRDDAHWLWSLSALTLPHGLVRVIVAEQLYRAASILGNHPYHRDSQI